MGSAYRVVLAIFGFSWAITDSFVLIGYILTLFLVVYHLLMERRHVFSISKGDTTPFALILWRLITSLENNIPLGLSVSKNLKFIFDISPVFIFRGEVILKFYKYILFSFLISLSIITLVSFLELFSIKNLDFFSSGMLEAFHRNHIKSGYIWSLASLISLVFLINTRNRYFIPVFFLLFIGLLLTHARSYYLGFLGASAFIFLYVGLKHSARHMIKGIILVSILILIGSLLDNVRSRFLSIFTELQTDTSIKCRLIFWEEALQAFRENPVFGIGFGGWQSFFGELQKLKGYECPNYHAHNIFIHEMVESGVMGIAILSIFLLYIFLKISKVYFRNNISIEAEIILLIGVSALVNMAVGGFFEPALVKSVVLIPTFTLVGLAMGVAGNIKSSSWLNSERTGGGQL